MTQSKQAPIMKGETQNVSTVLGIYSGRKGRGTLVSEGQDHSVKVRGNERNEFIENAKVGGARGGSNVAHQKPGQKSASPLFYQPNSALTASAFGFSLLFVLRGFRFV